MLAPIVNILIIIVATFFLATSVESLMNGHKTMSRGMKILTLNTIILHVVVILLGIFK
jgi:hypothetical protein